MNNNWEVKKLSEIVNFQRGLTYSKGDEVDLSSNIVLRANNVSADTNSLDLSELKYINEKIIVPSGKKVSKGSLIICTASGSKSHLGKVALIDDDYDFAFGGFMGQLTPKETIDSKYLFYNLTSESYKKFIAKLSSGMNINNLKFDDLKEFSFPLPPLAEQQRIVAILDEAFTAIAQAKENAEKNLQNTRELFDSYLQSVFANPGDGWERLRVDQICNSIIDCINKTAPVVIENTGFKMIRTTNIRFGKVDLSSVRYVSKETYLQWTRRQKPQVGDLLFTREAPMGEIGMLLSEDDVFLGQRIVSYRVNPNKVDAYFLLYAFQSNGLLNQIKKLASGATVQHLRVPDTKAFEFDIPSLETQQNIVRKLDALSVETKKLENIYRQKINDLDELKKSILQKAFSGELTAKKQIVKPIALHAGIIAYAYQRHYRKGRIGTFGHVKAEKITHLIQEVFNFELGRNPVKDSFGPNDFPQLNKVEWRAKKANYFNTVKEGKGYKYIPGNQFESLIEKTKTAFSDKADELTNLIDLLVPMDTTQAELVATVYAAWNNLLIDNLPITDEAIVTEARENWHEAKLKIERERFFKTINWMKENNLIPKGKGKKVLARK